MEDIKTKLITQTPRYYIQPLNAEGKTLARKNTMSGNGRC